MGLKQMKNFLIASLVLLLSNACANRNKADIVDTQLQNQSNVSNASGESVGVRDNEFVLQKKQSLSEELRKLEQNVRELDDRVYGTREYETYGLWGKLRDCSAKTKDKKSDYDAGPLQRISDEDYLLNWTANSDAKAGIEKSSDRLVALSEQDLDDHIKNMNKATTRLQQKEDELRGKLLECQTLIAQ
jgi:TolA-binding protein